MESREREKCFFYLECDVCRKQSEENMQDKLSMVLGQKVYDI
jgi:hypothetical protein